MRAAGVVDGVELRAELERAEALPLVDAGRRRLQQLAQQPQPAAEHLLLRGAQVVREQRREATQPLARPEELEGAARGADAGAGGRRELEKELRRLQPRVVVWRVREAEDALEHADVDKRGGALLGGGEEEHPVQHRVLRGGARLGRALGVEQRRHEDVDDRAQPPHPRLLEQHRARLAPLPRRRRLARLVRRERRRLAVVRLGRLLERHRQPVSALLRLDARVLVRVVLLAQLREEPLDPPLPLLRGGRLLRGADAQRRRWRRLGSRRDLAQLHLGRQRQRQRDAAPAGPVGSDGSGGVVGGGRSRAGGRSRLRHERRAHQLDAVVLVEGGERLSDDDVRRHMPLVVTVAFGGGGRPLDAGRTAAVRRATRAPPPPPMGHLWPQHIIERTLPPEQRVIVLLRGRSIASAAAAAARGIVRRGARIRAASSHGATRCCGGLGAPRARATTDGAG